MTASALRLSVLPKTWFIDVDGVVLRHNGHLTGNDELLPGAAEFWAAIGPDDLVVVVSARPESSREATLAVLARHDLRVDRDVFGAPHGERVLINDKKPSGLRTAYAVNVRRDEGMVAVDFAIDESL